MRSFVTPFPGLLAAIVLTGLGARSARAQEADVPGSKDHLLVARIPGASISQYDLKEYDEYYIPLGRADADSFVRSQLLGGTVTAITYENPANRSTLDIFQTYARGLRAAGFATLFSCINTTCGGDAGPVDYLRDFGWSANWGQRHFTGRLRRPGGDVYVSLHVQGKTQSESQTFLTVVEIRPMETGLVAVVDSATGAGLGDVDGSRDHPLVGRYRGASITRYDQKAFDEYELPLGPSEADRFTRTLRAAGKVTAITYANPPTRSQLEIFHNYEQALRAAGFDTLFTCLDAACGADAGSVDYVRDFGWSANWGERHLTGKRSRAGSDVYVSLHVQGKTAHESETVVTIVETQLQPGQPTEVAPIALPGRPPLPSGPPTAAGPAPAGLTASALGPTTIALHWTTPTGASGYRVYRSAGLGTDAILLTAAAVRETSYTDAGLIPRTTLTYLVAAVYPGGEGATATVSVTTPAAAPPMGLVASGADTNSIRVSWTAAPGASGYTVYRNGTAVTPQPIPGTIYLDGGLRPGTYAYKVQANYRLADWPTRGTSSAVASFVSAEVNGSTMIWGFADTHAHPFANLAFGGRLFWGKPFGPIAQALAWCDFDSGSTLFNPLPVHGPGGVGDLIGNALRGGTQVVGGGIGTLVGGVPGGLTGLVIGGLIGGGHLVGGYPQFDGWPQWNTLNHQQMYSDWLYRAYQGGLRLMVLHAVNNEFLCSLVNRAPGRSCSDMEAVDLQLNAARAMERYIDTESGGAGQGWFRIVTSPQMARDAITSGKLAVLLGIEVDNLFDCRASGGCSEQDVDAKLTDYYGRGVRHLFPIHFANNGFGGFAIFDDFFNINNLALTGRFVDAWDCSGEGIEFRFGATSPAYSLSRLTLDPRSPGQPSFPVYPSGGLCNQMGLTRLGEHLIRGMMDKGMIIDVDHMSLRATEQTFDVTRERRYPLSAGHTGFVATSIGIKKSEGQKTAAQLDTIRARGGLVSVILHQGDTSEVESWATSVANDCGESSRSWAQAYLYAVSRLGGASEAAVGLASDQGLNRFVGPRFGPSGCHHDEFAVRRQEALSHPIRYPFRLPGIPGEFDRSVAGQRTFDFNVDGLAHIGMLPDFVQDLQMLRVDVTPLFRSAEGYIRMWERGERSKPVPPQPPLVVFVEVGAQTKTSGTITVFAFNRATNAAVDGKVLLEGEEKGVTGTPVTFPPVSRETSDTGADGKPLLSPPEAPSGSVAAPGYPPVDFTVPLSWEAPRLKVTARRVPPYTGPQRGMVVTAADEASGQPITAIVKIGGGVAGQTGATIRYEACYVEFETTNAKGITVTRRRPVACEGVVRASGYAEAPFKTP